MECKRMPAFIKAKNMNPNRAAFSTSDRFHKGIVLIGFEDRANSLWQDSSWTKAGTLGPMAIDENGNVYVVPVPAINTLYNSAAGQNTIWKIDAGTGIMQPYLKLPAYADSTIKNPFGLLGIFYDCEKQWLLASSVYGSTPEQENGVIFCIDATTGKILSELKNTDAMGLCMTNLNGHHSLLFGSARNSDVFSISINDEGQFEGTPTKQLSIAELGPRGDDRVRKIRFNKQGELELYGVEFYFNLIAPTEKQESIYTFYYQLIDKGQWVFKHVDKVEIMEGY